MSDSGSQITYRQLLKRHEHIRIPLIQRDYAQGRPSEAEVREEFLGALEGALRCPADDPSLPLNLDFIYGSVEGKQETRFYPLDGQQRLTTLFLLHWFLAWRDERWADFGELFRTKGHSRFSYSVRPSSNEFFDELVAYEPNCRPETVQQLSLLIANQPWYFRNWRLDPTIQSTLVMLDAIHSRFTPAQGLFERLVSESRPAITFQLLDLNNFGLSDDLYIKMNARGKPLTQFETFKARYEQELTKQVSEEFRSINKQKLSIVEFVARRMDTTWSDFFWSYRDKQSNLYDNAVMNVFRALALVTRDPESKSYIEDVSTLCSTWRAPSYSDFHSKGWLDRNFTTTLICLLEVWSAKADSLGAQLPDNRFFDEEEILKKLIARPAELSYTEVVQFAAYSSFILKHEGTLDPQVFQDWMRIIFNLSVNTYYDRPDDLQRSMLGLKTLLPQSGSILKYFATSDKPTAGFSQQQISEEKSKAELILGHSGWRPLIERAEGHGYFRGQVEFLLDFCGAVEPDTEKGKVDRDDILQERFDEYLKKADTMFGPQGLNDLGAYRWQRALLSIGDYLLPSGGQNISFLENSTTGQASWKRLLRGTGPKVPEARKLLHQLWDRLTPGKPMKEQLDQIIADATTLETWREAFVRTPEAIKYCGNQAIRWNNPGEIYLLKKRQMNGAHAELFSFCLFENVLRPLSDELAPLILSDYNQAIGTDFEPHISMGFTDQGHQGHHMGIEIEFRKGSFVIGVDCTSLQTQPSIMAILIDSLGFVQYEHRL